MKASIIIRTKNEEKWIRRCLFAVSNQDSNNFEIIVVDNGSTDNTLEIVKQFNVKIVHYNENKYFPGKALNFGFNNSIGEYIVFLSGHCIPLNDKWLERLLVCFKEDDSIAAVYGRQEPLPDSNLFDKRDLWNIFGKEKRLQEEDYFFHNANSIIKREILSQIPFDENLPSIEDQAWAQKIISLGYKIFYEPHASVYHYHGVNQGYNEVRAEKQVEVIELLKRNGKA